jgi:probable addiction module antidote protein
MPRRVRDHHEWLLEQLSDPKFAEEYLNEAYNDSNQMFLKALRNVAEVRKMAAVAQEAGVNRETLYRTLSEEGNPSHTNLRAILEAVGMGFKLVRLQSESIATNPPPLTVPQKANLSIDGISTGFPEQIKSAATISGSFLSFQPSPPGLPVPIKVPTHPQYLTV